MLNKISIRFCDILFSLGALIILIPFFLIVMAILLCTGEKKIFYLQARVGKNKKPFKLIKFVTMLENSPLIGTGDITINNDPRVLPFGKILRRTKINELPQLINVIKGDMSLVGFRPHTQNALKYYKAADIILLTKYKPGLSGIASVCFSNEEDLLPSDKNEAILYYKKIVVPKKIELEKIWIKHYSFKLYLIVIIATIIKILINKNILENMDLFRTSKIDEK